jgi:hypothetical protein
MRRAHSSGAVVRAAVPRTVNLPRLQHAGAPACVDQGLADTPLAARRR